MLSSAVQERRRALAFRLEVRNSLPTPGPPCSATLEVALLSMSCTQAHHIVGTAVKFQA